MFVIESPAPDQEPCLQLKGEFTIYAVAQAKRPLEAALDPGPELRLNLAGVEEIDTAGVQLLLWLKQESGRRGRTLALTAHSHAVVEAFDLLNVGTRFGDPILLAPAAR